VGGKDLGGGGGGGEMRTEFSLWKGGAAFLCQMQYEKKQGAIQGYRKEKKTTSGQGKKGIITWKKGGEKIYCKRWVQHPQKHMKEKGQEEGFS